MEEKSHYHIETIKDHSFRLRHLPGGIFDMGDEVYGPIHKVELSPFYIGECPVTQALWKAVMGNEDNPSWFKGNDRPVENVSWIDIVEGSQDDDGRPAFLDRLNELTVNSRPSGHQYRLPTEAEWEYAARGGEPFLYSGSGQLKEVGWFSGNSHRETKAVGLKRPNGFGMYDMSGNVWEWCMDWYSSTFYEDCRKKGIVKDPLCMHTDDEFPLRVGRGGSWYYDPLLCRVSYRSDWRPALRFNFIGFRLVLAPV